MRNRDICTAVQIQEILILRMGEVLHLIDMRDKDACMRIQRCSPSQIGKLLCQLIYIHMTGVLRQTPGAEGSLKDHRIQRAMRFYPFPEEREIFLSVQARVRGIQPRAAVPFDNVVLSRLALAVSAVNRLQRRDALS